MKISISPFLGEIPKLSDKMLPNNNAQESQGCDFDAMTLKPMQAHTIVGSVSSSTKSIYRASNGTIYRWSQPDVNMVESPLNNDQWARIYWTGDGPPKMATATMAAGFAPPVSNYLLGVPAPSMPPTVTQPNQDEPEEGGYEINVIYAMTFVSEYGEEGPPSLASNMVTKWNGQTVQLRNIQAPPSGAYNISHKRLYRAESGGSFLFVADLPAYSSSFNDTVPTEMLGEPLMSLDWDMPDPRMIGLTNVGNGILAGWFENTLCFCEPYYPHAWPVSYQMGFDSNIVGIAPVSGGLIVATENEPWLVSGATPAAMSQTKLDFKLGCISRQSVVDMGEYAIYASSDGLVAVGGSTPNLITENIFSRHQWREINPESLHGFRWKEKYLAFYDDNGTTKGFIIDNEQGVVRFDIPPDIKYGVLDQSTGELLMVSGNTGNIYSFEKGPEGSFFWKSKTFTMPHLATMSALKVDGDNYPFNAKVFADGKQLLSVRVNSESFIRLPAGRYRNWEIELSGSGEVYSVQMASSPSELL